MHSNKEMDNQQEDFFELKQLDLLGEGRYGIVYKVYSHKFKTYFSLKKILKSKYSTDKIFYNEISILQSFIHPNIIKLYGFFTTSDSYNLISQLCTNGTLKTEVKKYGCFNVPKFSFVFRQILEAIAFSHSKKIAHCDLKPENILFDEYGRVQIADWGQATAIDDDNGVITKDCGTLSYSSPKCIKKQQFNAYKNDLYSIGVCMYFSVYGQDPWTEKVPIFKKQQIINNNYRILPSSVDKEVTNIIYQLLNIDESKRPSAKEVLELPLFQKCFSESHFCLGKTNKKRQLCYLPKKQIKKQRSLHIQNKIEL